MSWQELERGKSGEGVPTISVGTSKRAGRSNYGQVVINISASLAALIQVKPSERIDIDIGKLADDGWMRISKGNQYKAASHGHGGSIRVRFSARKWGIAGSNKPKPMKHTIHRDEKTKKTYIVFMMPECFRQKGE